MRTPLSFSQNRHTEFPQVATEAFSVSNQTVQMFSEGILASHQPESTSDR